MFAAGAGHDDIVKTLLDHGADPNAEFRTGGSALKFVWKRPLLKDLHIEKQGVRFD